jgi:hypothetical protein
MQISELADIARDIAGTTAFEDGVLEYLDSVSKDLQHRILHNKSDALIVHTFGKRIEKLQRLKLT